jgi:hypothetical protein
MAWQVLEESRSAPIRADTRIAGKVLDQDGAVVAKERHHTAFTERERFQTLPQKVELERARNDAGEFSVRRAEARLMEMLHRPC